MDKKVLAIIVAIVVIAAGLFMFMGKDDDEEELDNTQPTSQASNEETSENIEAEPESENEEELIEVSYTDEGFEPDEVTIQLGQTVTFVNNSSMSMWVASDDHPTHEELPGFDANQGVGPGESYEYTFDEVGEWGYHNHLDSGDNGQVTVVD